MNLTTAQKKLLVSILQPLSLLVLSFLTLEGNYFEILENRTWDIRSSIIAKYTEPDPEISIITIDQSSLDILASEEKQFWPWPREIYSAIIEYLREAGVKGVAFDILFSEQSSYGTTDDLAFANSLTLKKNKGDNAGSARLPVIMAAALRDYAPVDSQASQQILDFPQEKFARLKEIQSDASQKIQTVEKLKAVEPYLNYLKITGPNEQILEKTDYLGNVSSPNDKDGIFRQIIPYAVINKSAVLTLPFSLANSVVGDAFYAEIADLPVSYDGKLVVRFAGPAKTYRSFSFAGVLRSYQQLLSGVAPQIPLAEFKDNYVFIGMTAPGLLDLRPISLSQNFPGVEYHANVLDNILHKKFIRRTSMQENLLFCLAALLLITSSCLYLKNTFAIIIANILIFAVMLLGSAMLGVYGIWIALAVPVVFSILSLITALAFQYQLEGSNFRFIKQAFRFYVSSKVIDKIIDNPQLLQLGGERKELTMFFSDIENFTALSESLDPRNLGLLLNKFLTVMTNIILDNQGTVDKYVGDAIVAFWGAPIDINDHAYYAVKSAIECQGEIERLRTELEREFGVSFRMRIGIHTGEVYVGNFGSQKRFNYTILGDGANLASRIEGVNKLFGTDILISQATYTALRGRIEALEIGIVKVTGRNAPVVLYTPQVRVPGIDAVAWNEMLQLYKSGKARDALAKIDLIPDSMLKATYTDRLTEISNARVDVDKGIWEMKIK